MNIFANQMLIRRVQYLNFLNTTSIFLQDSTCRQHLVNSNKMFTTNLTQNYHLKSYYHHLASFIDKLELLQEDILITLQEAGKRS